MASNNGVMASIIMASISISIIEMASIISKWRNQWHGEISISK
jgi:hypothetical protein